jgi:hypothetical protein
MAYEIRSVSVDGSFDKGIRHYTRTYKVWTDSTMAGPGQVATLAPDILYAGWSHGTEVDNWALCKKKSARCLSEADGGFLWTVTAEYDSEPFEQAQNGTSPSGGPSDPAQTTPTARPWQITFSSNKVTKLLGPEDLAGVSVVASNGQPFDPPPEIPYARPTITIVAYKAIGADSLANVALYVNSINAGAWQGFNAKRCMCTDYQLQSQFEQGAWYWQKTVTIEIYDEDLNPVKVVDAGTYEQESAGLGTYKPILDATGNPISSPVPLDGAGHKLTAPPLQYREFTGYREVNWANII